MAKKQDESENKKKEKEFFPVRLPSTLVKIMDEFIKRHPELAIVSRQELARRAIAEWVMTKQKELKEE